MCYSIKNIAEHNLREVETKTNRQKTARTKEPLTFAVAIPVATPAVLAGIRGHRFVCAPVIASVALFAFTRIVRLWYYDYTGLNFAGDKISLTRRSIDLRERPILTKL